MLYLLTLHGLVPIPIDIDPATLMLDLSQLKQSVGPHTKAIVVAHLFGNRMCLDLVVDIARQHRLLVIEDCAQAYDGSSYRGHSASDISMFSFGPIKMQTALGGGLLRVRDQALLAKLRRRQAQYERQPRLAFMRRIARFMLLVALARPWLFAVFIVICRLRRIDHDMLLNQAMRGFAGPDLLKRLRQQPSAPLLRLLHRRLLQACQQRIERRAAWFSRVVRQQPRLMHFGAKAQHHTHWVLPIKSSDPELLVALLRVHGFDATRKASSMIVVPPTRQLSSSSTPKAQQMLDQLVYLPVSPAMTTERIAHLRQIVLDFELHHMESTYTNNR
jgi:dTDP-4-amino-4,6-dideoxygalactose transaminase